MADPGNNRDRSLVRYKPDISLGNILTMAAMACAVIVWGLRLEGRVSEEVRAGQLQQQNNELRFTHLEATMSQMRADWTTALSDIKVSLRRIEEKLDSKADKPR